LPQQRAQIGSGSFASFSRKSHAFSPLQISRNACFRTLPMK